jgi:hypothetical protein
VTLSPIPPTEETYHGTEYVQDSAVVSSSIEPNWGLQGARAVGDRSTPGEWAEMLRTNVAASLGARALLATLSGVSHDISAHPDADPRVVAFVRSLLFEQLARPFTAYTEKIFSAILFGFSANELISKQVDGLWYLADIGYRKPQTIRLDTVKRNADGWLECVQEWRGSSGSSHRAEYSGPGVAGKGWLWWITFGTSSLLGDSILRPVYGAYKTHNEAIRIRNIATQKAVLGSPTIISREGTSLDGSAKGRGPSKEAVTATVKAVAKQRSIENGVVALPGWVESIENPFVVPGVIEQLTAVINDCSVKILLGFFSGQFARGLLAQFGTNAASESDADAQKALRRSFLEFLKIEVQFLINYFVELNFGVQRYYPELTSTYIDEMPVEARVATMVQAVGAGLYKPSKLDRDEFRALMRIGAVEEENKAAEGQLLNGAQVSSIVSLLAEVTAGRMTRDSANALLGAGFGLAPDVAGAIVGTGIIAPVAAPAIAAKMVCSCGQVHKFVGGVRMPPRPGGRDQYTGPDSRALSADENLCDWRAIEFAMDNGERDLDAVLRAQQALVADELLKQITGDKWTDSAQLAKFLADQSVPESLHAMVRTAIAEKLTALATSAATELASEYKAQTGKDIDTDSLPWLETNDYIKTKATTIAGTIIADVKDQLVSFSLAISAPTREAVLLGMLQAKKELSQGAIGPIAPLVTSEVYARARAEEVKAIAEMGGEAAQEIHYSAVLDANSCDACRQADTDYGPNGKAIMPGSAEETEYMPPYQRCAGGVRCRCMFIYTWPRS